MRHLKNGLHGSILILTLILTPSALGAFQNEPTAFRGVVWGANTDELAGMTRVHAEGSLVYYIKANEEMTIGDAPIKSVVYVFYRNKFCGAVIDFKSSGNFQIIKQTLFNLHGKGNQPRKYKEYYGWSGKDITLTLEYDDITQKGQIKYYYMPIYSKIQRAERRRGS
jgi:hypothetical protein